MSQFKENGQINTVFLPSLLIDIYKNQKNGSLELVSSTNLKIYFDKGTPFYAEGGDDETLLVNLLLKENKISDNQYEEILDKINTTDTRVGELIMNMGILNPHELNEYLELQIREKIIRGLTYTDGSYKFEDISEFPSSIFYCRLELNTIIFETLNRFIDTSGVDIKKLGLKVNPELGDMLNKLNLGPKELRVAQLLTKGAKISEIAGPENPDRGRNIVLLLFLSLYKFVYLENFSVVDFCKDAFIQFRKDEQSDQSQEAPSGDEENMPIIDLEDEITEKKANVPEKGVEINEEETVTENTFQTNTGFRSDFRSDSEGIELDIANEDEQAYSNKTENHLTDNKTASEYSDIPGKEEVEIDTNDRDGETSLDTSEHLHPGNTVQEIQSKDFHNQNGIEIGETNPEVMDSEKEDISEDDITATDSRDKSELINEITEFYEYVSEEDDSFGILGIGRDATDTEVKEAYFTLVKKFHPDANPNFPKEIRSKAETIFTKVTQAYENLSSQEKRDSYESLKEVDKVKGRAQSIYDAEILYTEGELLLRQRRYKEACEKFFTAIELNPEEAAYIGALSWARFLSFENKNSIIKDSVKELEKATSMDDTVAQNFFYLGSVYKFMNDTKKAEKNFQKAVELDPHYIQAKRELRLIQSRKKNKDGKQKENKNSDGKFWSGLFKK